MLTGSLKNHKFGGFLVKTMDLFLLLERFEVFTKELMGKIIFCCSKNPIPQQQKIMFLMHLVLGVNKSFVACSVHILVEN